MRGTLFAVSLLAMAVSQAQAAEPLKAAFFGIELINTSLEKVSAEEETRIANLEQQVREAMLATGRYEFVDISPVAEKADKYAHIANCNGCDSRLATELGADLAVTGEVQKVSNLILNISVYMRDAATGVMVRGGTVDIRGNTDVSWNRGMRYLLKNRVLKE